MADPRLVTLGNLGNGAASELFAAKLGEVLDNIDDENTDAKAKRQITLTFVFQPEADRRTTRCEVAVGTKLAPIRRFQTTLALGQHLGARAAVEPLAQEELFNKPIGRPERMPQGPAYPVPAAQAAGQPGDIIVRTGGAQ